jgi:hypothetical protein
LDWSLFLQPKQNKRTFTIANSLPYLTTWVRERIGPFVGLFTEPTKEQSCQKVLGLGLYRRNGENVDKNFHTWHLNLPHYLGLTHPLICIIPIQIVRDVYV